MPAKKPSQKSGVPPAILIIPELEHTETAVLNTLVSVHSRRAYKHAIDKFIAWYCSEPRLGFNRSVVLRYRSFLESLQLSAATINLHLCAIRRLADEAAESCLLSPNWQLASVEPRESSGSAGGSATGCLGTRQKNC
jgi:hypothetical protein